MILFVKLQLLLGDLPVAAPEMLRFKLDFANHCTSPSYCALSKQSWQESSCRTHYSHIDLETVLSDSHFTEPRYTTTRRQLYLACTNLGGVDFGLEHINSLFQIASKQREITGASILVTAPQASGSVSTRTDNDKEG